MSDEDKKSSTWPAFVGQHYNLELTNLAEGANSNHWIFQQLVQHAINFDYVLIGWTEIARFTRHRYISAGRSDPSNHVHFSQRLKNQNSDEFQTYGKYHYLYWYDHLNSFKEWLGMIVMSQRYLEALGIQYHMINGARVKSYYEIMSDDFDVFFNYYTKSIDESIFKQIDNDTIRNIHNEIQDLKKQINFNHFTAPTEFNILSDIVRSGKYNITACQHPMPDGHQAIANYLINKNIF